MLKAVLISEAIVVYLVAMSLMNGAEVGAECCLPLTGLLKCQDCTSGKPYCGIGDCNMFGCECQGGCKQGLGCPAIKDVVAGWVNQAATILEPAPVSVPAPYQQGGHVARRAVLVTGEDIIRQADQDGDGKLNEIEADAWLQHHNHEALVKSISSHFVEVDRNQDGLLEPTEIDGDLTVDSVEDLHDDHDHTVNPHN